MEHTITPATYDDLTGTEIGTEFQRILCFHCWDMRFYHCDAHIKRIFNGGKPSLVGQNGEQTFIIKIRELDDSENGERAPGKLPPKLRKRLDKELEENYIDKHLVHEDNLCLANEEQRDEIIANANARIKRKENKLNVDKKYYRPGLEGTEEEHPKFDVNMPAGDLKQQLTKAAEIKNDTRFKWTEKLKIQLLTRKMSDELKRRIRDKRIKEETRGGSKPEAL